MSTSRRFRRSALLSLTALCALTFQIHTQTLVPFDREGRIIILDAALNARHAFFDTTAFVQGMITRQSDSTWSLEIVRQSSMGFTRRAIVLSPRELDELRTTFGLKLGNTTVTTVTSVPDPAGELGDGNDIFVQSVVGLGIAWYGWTLPALIREADGSASLGLYLLSGAGAYFYASKFVDGRSLTVAQGYAFQYFASRGVILGYGLHNVLVGSWTNSQTGVPFATAASIGLGAYALRKASDAGWTLGEAKAIGTIGDAGILLGIGMAYLTADGEPAILTDGEDHPSRYGIGVVVGGTAGLLVGSGIADRGIYSPGDPDLQESAGYLGALAGFTVMDLLQRTGRKSQVAGAAGGLIVGHILGSVLCHSTDLTRSEGRKLSLLTSAGIFVGLGIAEIIGAKGGDRSLFLVLGTAGGATGLAAALNSSGGHASTGLLPEMSINPAGLVAHVQRDPATHLARLTPALQITLPL